MLHSIKKPALVIVDMQNDFVRLGAPMEVPVARSILPLISNLSGAFRAKGYPVIFTRYLASPNYQLFADKLPWLELLEPPTCACTPGVRRAYADISGSRDGADVVDELSPKIDDFIVDKVFFSAFYDTDLNKILRMNGVDGLIVTGTLTEMCVEDTARHAVHFGYPTILVRDGVASNDKRVEAMTLATFERNYGWVLDGAKILELLGFEM